MEQFDSLFFKVFQYYKPTHKAKANTIALLYVLVLQTSLLLALGSFFIMFLGQMHVDMISPSKAWTIFVIVVIILAFRNWIYYTGKKRKVLNTKTKIRSHTNTNIWMLWCFPIVLFIISMLLLQRL